MASFLSKILGPMSGLLEPMGSIFGGSNNSRNSDSIPGFSKIPTMSSDTSSIINQILAGIPQQNQMAQQGFASFLPGGSGNNPIIEKANQNFQQKTLPGILNSFGSNVGFGDSSLNQALAAGASNLNTNIADILARNQLTAAQGLGNLSSQNFATGINKDQFDYLREDPSGGGGQEAIMQLIKILPSILPFLI